MTTHTSVDPTAFPIEFDPATQRMVGIAVHGNTPFDVPFISQIQGNLWQGGCADGLILPPYIENVISLYKWEKYTITHELDSYMEVTMHDSTAGVDMVQVIALAEWVNACRYRGPTLVHCQAGLNRSSLVAVTALIISGDMDAPTAIAHIRAQRSPACLCNPTFLRFVQEVL